MKTGGRLTSKELYRVIWHGSFPALALNEAWLEKAGDM